MEHKPETKDVKTTLYFDGRPSRVLVRIPCSCGWRGCWYGDLGNAHMSYQRHAVKVGPVQNVPRRDCGHPFLTVGPCVSCPPEPVETL